MLPNICEIAPNKISTNLKSKYFFFYGEQGTWKTTVASKFPKVLIVGGEIGYQFIDGVRAVPIAGWSDMKDLYRQLKTKEARAEYDTIAFDTISALYTMCYKYVLGQYGVDDPGEVPFGKGWRAIREEFGIIKEISKLGYGLVFIAHGKEVEITDKKSKETFTKVKVDLDNSAMNMVSELVDFVFYVRKEKNEAGVEQVYAYSALPDIETKRRLKEFPDRILFTFDELVKNLGEAIEQHRVNSGGTAVDDSAVNIREVQQEDFAVIQKDVIELVKKLMSTNAGGEVERYITEIFPGVKLSQTTELHREKLVAARDYLKGLDEKLGQ